MNIQTKCYLKLLHVNGICVHVLQCKHTLKIELKYEHIGLFVGVFVELY